MGNPPRSGHGGERPAEQRQPSRSCAQRSGPRAARLLACNARSREAVCGWYAVHPSSPPPDAVLGWLAWLPVLQRPAVRTRCNNAMTGLVGLLCCCWLATSCFVFCSGAGSRLRNPPVITWALALLTRAQHIAATAHPLPCEACLFASFQSLGRTCAPLTISTRILPWQGHRRRTYLSSPRRDVSAEARCTPSTDGTSPVAAICSPAAAAIRWPV